MNRNEAIQLNNEMRSFLNSKDCSVDWLMDTGKVVCKRNGSVIISFSVRDEQEQSLVNGSIREFLNDKGIIFKIRVTNMMNTYRPEIRLSVTIPKQ